MINLTEHGTPQLNAVHHCRAEAMLSALDTASVDLIVTSPPYDNLRTYNGFSWNFEYIAQQSYRVLKPGGVLVWVVDDSMVDGSKTLTGFRQAIYFTDIAGFRFHQHVIWEQNSVPQKRIKAYYDDFENVFVFSKDEPRVFNPIMRPNTNAGQVKKRGHSGKNGYGYTAGVRVVNPESMLTNVWRITVGFNQNTHDAVANEHPAIFPETLAERHILTWSNAGDVVLDYFGGSGTTAKMARKNGRQYITNDISQEYCQLMERRLTMPYTPSFMPMLESA